MTMFRLPLVLPLTAMALVAMAAPAIASDDVVTPPQQEQTPPQMPLTPAQPEAIVIAQPFVLDEPFTSEWRAERPSVRAGWLVVIKAAPELLYPRQVAEPVLYAGQQPAERVNIGYESGYLVAIIGGELGEDGTLTTKLSELPIFFGEPALPEQVDTPTATGQMVAAQTQGITPFSARQIDAARAKGRQTLKSDSLHVANKEALLRQAAQLLRVYAPGEETLIDSLDPKP